MKLLVAITLVVIAMVGAEPPHGRTIFQRQTAAPYQPRGWRPNGPAFNPTQFKSQRQQQAPPEPAASYGPPPNASYGPPESDATTTEEPTTTETFAEVATPSSDLQGEDLKSELLRKEKTPEKLQNEPQSQSSPVYVVIPQGQNFLYTTALRPASAALIKPSDSKQEVEIIKEPKLAPVQAIPALAKIQAPIVLARYEQIPVPQVLAKYEPVQVPQVVQFQQIQAVPYIRYASSLSQSAIRTPYSDSFVQVYQ